MATEDKKSLPGHTDEAYPEIFNKMIPQPTEKKHGQLPENIVKQFFEKGYVVVEDYFPKELLEETKKGIEVLVDDLAQKLYKAGKIKNLYTDVGLFQRLTKIEEEFPGANILLHKSSTSFKPFKNIWAYEPLLNAVEQLIGPEIAAHPVWNLRTKTPQNEATTVPWHQDVGYLDNSSYKVMQATAWIPFLDATPENGCMQVVEKGHKTGKVADHQCCYGGTWYVMLFEDEMENKLDVDVKRDVRTCPVPYGGMLLINNVIPHRSLSNLSNDIRWSVDLRWQNPNYPAGFYGIKESLLLRSPKYPNLKVDWDSWNNVDYKGLAKKMVEVDMPEITGDANWDEDIDKEFDTTITGPWMKKWDLIHMNRHTEKMLTEA
ncbi:hypothetical protein LOTGIDRAFT_233877 [Lottia gigantea]|uniref:Uncharacterized protein n=1 Tax=Lottia gigantea TaxID=225164 RepID=V4A065_LOTGI|nr:hypothetical protein LOTGIDRAFT_233877 [Lottia gigantea]ESO90037.1 hypothetical protein LOTGIDRAFT_233877 [Lottia gigantea]